VTARVLWGLGESGVTRDDPVVCHAIEYLKSEQCASGAFWDRWMTCYLPGTATVLLGLHAVGEDMGAGYVRRATDWLKSRQNADGGFGETSRAFRDPLHAGRGPSMPAVTALVVAALVDAGEAESEAVQSAIAYLLRTQTAEGTWDGHGWVNPYVPPDTFYAYGLPSRTLPMLALGRALRALDAKRSTSGYPAASGGASAE
jgi:squalene-hopene/tetraprenyl-beta-curcumene cyclase